MTERPDDTPEHSPRPWWSPEPDASERAAAPEPAAHPTAEPARPETGPVGRGPNDAVPGSPSSGADPSSSPWARDPHETQQLPFLFAAPQDDQRRGGPQAETGRQRRGRRSAMGVAAVIAAAAIGGGAGAATTYALTTHDSSTSTLSTPAASALPSTASGEQAKAVTPAGSVAAVAQAVLPSVVQITVRSASESGTGTGFVISGDGEILTNNHVVAGATDGQGSVTVEFNDGQRVEARILGTDPTTDLAVIKVNGVKDLKPVKLGSSSDLQVGQQVVAIGSPLGLSGTVTSGIVSALDRPVRTGGADASGEDRTTVIDAIQTDAAINPGNSGGPLVDMSGRVVGINSAIATLGASAGGQSGSIGLGFSIPIDQARPIAQQLAQGQSATHALLGVSVTDVTDNGEPAGAGVQQVTPGSAAAQGGIEAGSVITKVDSRVIDTADTLIAEIRSHRPGEKVTVTWLPRGSSTPKSASVTLGSDAATSRT
ncbi:MAG: trypsin-like peptidase domain-containing protein [Actinomycetales bacterium]